MVAIHFNIMLIVKVSQVVLCFMSCLIMIVFTMSLYDVIYPQCGGADLWRDGATSEGGLRRDHDCCCTAGQ